MPTGDLRSISRHKRWAFTLRICTQPLRKCYHRLLAFATLRPWVRGPVFLLSLLLLAPAQTSLPHSALHRRKR